MFNDGQFDLVISTLAITFKTFIIIFFYWTCFFFYILFTGCDSDEVHQHPLTARHVCACVRDREREGGERGGESSIIHFLLWQSIILVYGHLITRPFNHMTLNHPGTVELQFQLVLLPENDMIKCLVIKTHQSASKWSESSGIDSLKTRKQIVKLQ